MLSCTTTLALGLIQPCTRLDCLPPRASFITSSSDHPKMTKSRVSVHSSKQEVSAQSSKQETTVFNVQHVISKLVTSKEQILQRYPDIFDGIGCFPGFPYHIQLDTNVTPKQTPCGPIPVHLKEAFKQDDKMLKTGVLKTDHEATPWINSFMLVEGKEMPGNLKLRICLDPTNLNKTVMKEPYHFKTLEDKAHLFVDACIMTVCDCKKGYWHQQLGEASSLLTTINIELGRFRYTMMPFGATVAGDVFQCNLDQCFENIKHIIVIADDIMIVGKKQNHSNHDQALKTLLDTARRSNVRLNYEKLQYKKDTVDFFSESYTTTGCKPDPSKVSANQDTCTSR